jgi:hypothetical protein
MSPRKAPTIVSFAIPAIEPRQAEVLMDLLEQLQAALWQAYGDAILAAKDDPRHDAANEPTSDPDHSSSF